MPRTMLRTMHHGNNRAYWIHKGIPGGNSVANSLNNRQHIYMKHEPLSSTDRMIAQICENVWGSQEGKVQPPARWRGRAQDIVFCTLLLFILEL